MPRLLGLLGLLFSMLAQASEKPVEKIAFGSCNLQLRPQTHWNEIAKEKSELWIWMGDIVYTDFLKTAQREREYLRVKQSPGYQELLKSTKVLGTWDDHDYGKDNSGIAFGDKVNSQRLLLDFLDEPASSPRRQRQGVYGSYVAGPKGQQVKVVLMDLRYFRESAAPLAQLLGETQWQWLEAELTQGDEALILLVSSSQLLPFDTDGDKWADYPMEKARLLNLMTKSKRNYLILIGDVHFAEISRQTVNGQDWFEATSSGLTHVTQSTSVANSLRVGPFLPKMNYGLLELSWGNHTLDVNIQLKSVHGTTYYSHPVTYSW